MNDLNYDPKNGLIFQIDVNLLGILDCTHLGFNNLDRWMTDAGNRHKYSLKIKLKRTLGECMSKKEFLIHRPHPWHGISVGLLAPKIVTAYVEITANEVIKYEICKTTGYLKVDRPQRFSSVPGTLYGFIPQTYSAERTAARSKEATKGDGDPLDICILSELPIEKSDIIMDVRIIGGIRLIDSNEVDDKLIAVLNGDPYFKNVQDIEHINPVVLDRMKHYFLSYKTLPHEPAKTKIESIYGAQEAYLVVEAGREDYKNHFL